MVRYRLTVGLAVLAMIATACGSRVDDQTRLEVTSPTVAQPGSGTAAPSDAGGDTDAAPDGSGDTSQTPDASSPGADAGPDAGAGTGTDTDAGPGASTDPGQGSGATPTDTRAAPAGGNGGATDIGITEDLIKIANVADISGPVPGIFEDAQRAVQAYAAFFAATEGTVYGRRVEVVPLDSKLTDGGNREKYQQACEETFMAVGSASAADGGASGPVADCGLPDLRAGAFNESIQKVDEVFGIDAMKPGLLPVSEYNYWAEQHPEAVKKAAYLWINNATTTYQTEQNRAGTRKIGYEWIYEKPIDIAETNYSSFVVEMKNLGVEFVTIQGAIQQAANLANAMKQQGFEPAVYALQTNVYTPDLIAIGGDAIEGAQLAVTGSLLEEIELNAEMQLYAQWLQQIDPNARPTGLGMYAWSATRLFIDLIKEIGPDLTREKMLTALAGVHGFDGNGLIPPQDVGTKVPTDCINIVEVQNGAFVRVEPSAPGTFRCDNQVVPTT